MRKLTRLIWAPAVIIATVIAAGGSSLQSGLFPGGSGGSMKFGDEAWQASQFFSNAAAENAPFTGVGLGNGTVGTAVPEALRFASLPGGVFIRSGTAANNGYRYYTRQLIRGGGGLTYRAILALVTAHTGRTLRVGFGTSTDHNDHAHGVYFEIVAGECFVKTADNSTRSSVKVADLALSTYYVFDITYRADSVVQFVVTNHATGAVVANARLETNVPSAANRSFLSQVIATEGTATQNDIAVLQYCGMGPARPSWMKLPAAPPGVLFEPFLEGWGETPYVDVTLDYGYPVSGTLTAAVTGNEMYSVGMSSGTIKTLSAASSVSERIYLPWTVRAFKGDAATFTAVLTGFGTITSSGHVLGNQLPGTMKHAVVRSSFGAPNANATLYQRYLDYDAEEYVYDGESRDIKLVGRSVDQVQWDGVGDNYSATASTYRMIKSDLTMPIDDQDPRYLIYYTNIEDLVPDNSRLIDVRLNVFQSFSTVFQSITDTLYAVLIENPSDNLWYTYDELGWPEYGGIGNPGLAHATWKYQIQGNDDAASGANATTIRSRIGNVDRASLGEWDPPLDERTEIHHWGSMVQFTSERHPDDARGDSGYGGAVARWQSATSDWYAYQTTNLVRHVKLGGVNNGWLIGQARAGASISTVFQNAGPHHSTAGSRPFITLSYIEGLPEEKIFDGSMLALSWSSDDGHTASNDAWSAVSAELNAPFTINVNIQESPQYYNAADLRRWRADGNEIGAHSRRHGLGTTEYCVTEPAWTNLRGSFAVPTYTCTDWMPPQRLWPDDVFAAAGSGIDSLLVDFDPCWLYEYVGPGYELDPFFVKTMALPNNRYNMPGLYILHHLGYRSVRTAQASTNDAGVNLPVDGGPWYDWRGLGSADAAGCGSEGAAVADSVRATWVMHDPWQPVNILGFAPTIRIDAIIGQDVNPQLTEAEVKRRTRYQIVRHIGKKQPVSTWFVHVAKGVGGYADPGKMSADEWRWIAEECQRLGVPILRAKEVADYKWVNSVAVDTPATWGYYSESPGGGRDPYRWTREDEFFRRPTWLHANLVYGGIPYRGSGTSWTP